MNSTATYRPPRGWLRVGKYLLPVGMKSAGLWPTPAPLAQVPIAWLALEHPECVRYEAVGEVETLARFPYACHESGVCETRTLSPQSFSPAYVARLKDGLSFGRHCCVIGPERKAVRETGFYLDGAVHNSNVSLSPLRLRYWRKRWASDVTSRLWLPPKQRIAGRVAVLNARYSHNYFHWIIEILPRLATILRAGATADYYLVDCLSQYQRDALAALGVAPHQLIQPHCKLLVEAEELVLPSFPSPQCLRECARWLLVGLGADARVTAPRRIFITRRKTGTRTLANERQLEQLLRGRGFETHSMEDYPLAKQARLVHEAEMVVATHGAGLANLVFARPGLRVIEIVPAGRFNATCYPKRTRFLGLHHQLVFAACPGRKQVLSVSLGDVRAALDRAEGSEPRASAA